MVALRNPVEVKARINLVDFLQSQGIDLKRTGRVYRACCPFHAEKTPSFVVYPDTQTWRCYGACACGGDVIDFAQRRNNYAFAEAVRSLDTGYTSLDSYRPLKPVQAALPPKDSQWASDQERLIVRSKAALQRNSAALAYLHGRALTDATIERFGLGWDGERIVWAWRAAGGEIVNVRRRSIDPGCELRYLNVSGSQMTGSPLEADRFVPGKPTILCEGEINLFSIWQALDQAGRAAEFNLLSWGNAGGSPKPDHVALVKQSAAVYLRFDSDQAGNKTRAAWCAALGGLQLFDIETPGDDPNDYLIAGGDLVAAVDQARPILNMVPTNVLSAALHVWSVAIVTVYLIGMFLQLKAFTKQELIDALSRLGVSVSSGMIRRMIEAGLIVECSFVSNRDTENTPVLDNTGCTLPLSESDTKLAIKRKEGRSASVYRFATLPEVIDLVRAELTSQAAAPALVQRFYPDTGDGLPLPPDSDLIELSDLAINEFYSDKVGTTDQAIRQRRRAAFDRRRNDLLAGLSDTAITPIRFIAGIGLRALLARAVHEAGNTSLSRSEAARLTGCGSGHISRIFDEAGLTSAAETINVPVPAETDVYRVAKGKGRIMALKAYNGESVACSMRFDPSAADEFIATNRAAGRRIEAVLQPKAVQTIAGDPKPTVKAESDKPSRKPAPARMTAAERWDNYRRNALMTVFCRSIGVPYREFPHDLVPTLADACALVTAHLTEPDC